MSLVERMATKDERVDHIIRLMLQGKWHGMKSRAELSALWDIHEHTVGDYASIASGFCSRLGKDLETEAREALAELDAIKRMALEYVTFGKDGTPYEQPKLKEATDAIRLKMDILGITSRRNRNEASKPAVDDKYANATREERIAMLEQALAEEKGELQ